MIQLHKDILTNQQSNLKIYKIAMMSNYLILSIFGDAPKELMISNEPKNKLIINEDKFKVEEPEIFI